MQAVADTSHWHDDGSGAELALSAGSVIAGRYRLDEIIGRGGMATVWRGHDERLGRDVAVKICPPETPGAPVRLREERLSSALLHPNVVSIFDAGDISAPEVGAGSTFIVMEYVRGTTAHQIAPVSWREAVGIIRQAADGLAAAHERGIVHCDVKPGNLLIDQRGRVLVADFGIAVPAESELGEFVHGSPAYVAPERLAGERADARVDVYGLGGVLSFLITGTRPTDDRISLPLDCPSGIGNVIALARSRNPDERYANAQEFRAALDRAVGAESIHRRADTVITERPASLDTHRLRQAEFASPRRVISHPARVRPVNPRHSAQQTAAMSPSPVRIARPLAGRQTRQAAVRKRLATQIAVGIAGLMVLLMVGAVLRDIVSIDSAASGPVPVAAASDMPNVEGQTFATAIATLAEQGIVVERVDVIYSPGPANKVVAQHPPAGAPVSDDNSVTLVVRANQ